MLLALAHNEALEGVEKGAGNRNGVGIVSRLAMGRWDSVSMD